MKSYEEQLEELKKDLLSAFTDPDAQNETDEPGRCLYAGSSDGNHGGDQETS